MSASANYYTIRMGTVNIGERSSNFSITTIQENVSTSNTRDNDNFINKSFWNTNPTSGQIINALFGDGNGNGTGGTDTTAYTRHWTGNCNIWSMNVLNISNFDTSGIDSLPLGLAANTIYVLDPGRYIMSNTIDFSGNCIAIIGK
jgi:hypothetical protein